MEIGQMEWIITGAVIVVAVLGFLGTRREPRTALGSDAHRRAPAPSSTASNTNADVHPIAEAEVYLAYGRKEQAIEILEEALRANSAREDVRKKLNEIKAGS